MGQLAPVVHLAGGALGRSLPLINAVVADVPNDALRALGGNLLIAHISLDRHVVGVDGTHRRDGRRDRGPSGTRLRRSRHRRRDHRFRDRRLARRSADGSTGGASRVDQFVDFVNGRTMPYDDYGHGTHVAGIVAGNGFDSGGARTGIAPAARIDRR